MAYQNTRGIIQLFIALQFFPIISYLITLPVLTILKIQVIKRNGLQPYQTLVIKIKADLFIYVHFILYLI